MLRGCKNVPDQLVAADQFALPGQGIHIKMRIEVRVATDMSLGLGGEADFRKLRFDNDPATKHVDLGRVSSAI